MLYRLSTKIIVHFVHAHNIYKGRGKDELRLYIYINIYIYIFLYITKIQICTELTLLNYCLFTSIFIAMLPHH